MDTRKILQQALLMKILNDNDFNNKLVQNANLLDLYNNIRNDDTNKALQNWLVGQSIGNEKPNIIKKINESIKPEDFAKVKLLSEMPLDAMNYFQEHSTEFESLWDQKVESAIISIDIRKSTDLMLKADDDIEFSIFISELVEKLISIIKSNNGLIEKFTGDGVLAFFPKIYAGTHAIVHCINAAIECHGVFEEIYNAYKSKFTAVLSNTGLGIGIDYGNIIIKDINRSLNIIGRPVVYGCRMSGISAGKTALNVKAYEEVYKLLGNSYFFYPEAMTLKTGEEIICYCVKKKPNIKLKLPEWNNRLTSAST